MEEDFEDQIRDASGYIQDVDRLTIDGEHLEIKESCDTYYFSAQELRAMADVLDRIALVELLEK